MRTDVYEGKYSIQLHQSRTTLRKKDQKNTHCIHIILEIHPTTSIDNKNDKKRQEKYTPYTYFTQQTLLPYKVDTNSFITAT